MIKLFSVIYSPLVLSRHICFFLCVCVWGGVVVRMGGLFIYQHLQTFMGLFQHLPPNKIT